MSAMSVTITKWASSEGYVIAGFSQDLFEGAEFLYPPSYIDGDIPREDELKFSTRGTVLEIVTRSESRDWKGLNFVYLTEDGEQITESFGYGLALRFKDPEAKK